GGQRVTGLAELAAAVEGDHPGGPTREGLGLTGLQGVRGLIDHEVDGGPRGRRVDHERLVTGALDGRGTGLGDRRDVRDERIADIRRVADLHLEFALATGADGDQVEA